MTDDPLPRRWVGTGWTVFNNKGKPVRQYEPFFSDTHRFDFEARIGVSPVLFYDPAERVVAVLHPDHTYEKVVFDPWRHRTSDLNDTVAGDPRIDPDIRRAVAGHFAREGPGWQTWRALRQRRGHGHDGCRNQGGRARGYAHHRLPRHTWAPLPDPRAQRCHAGGDPVHLDTRVVLDIEGNERAVVDAEGRTSSPTTTTCSATAPGSRA